MDAWGVDRHARELGDHGGISKAYLLIETYDHPWSSDLI